MATDFQNQIVAFTMKIHGEGGGFHDIFGAIVSSTDCIEQFAELKGELSSG